MKSSNKLLNILSEIFTTLGLLILLLDCTFFWGNLYFFRIVIASAALAFNIVSLFSDKKSIIKNSLNTILNLLLLLFPLITQDSVPYNSKSFNSMLILIISIKFLLYILSLLIKVFPDFKKLFRNIIVAIIIIFCCILIVPNIEYKVESDLVTTKGRYHNILNGIGLPYDTIELPDYLFDTFNKIHNQEEFNNAFNILSSATLHYDGPSSYTEPNTVFNDFLEDISQTKEKLVSQFNIDNNFFDNYIIIWFIGDRNVFHEFDYTTYNPVSNKINFVSESHFSSKYSVYPAVDSGRGIYFIKIEKKYENATLEETNKYVLFNS